MSVATGSYNRSRRRTDPVIQKVLALIVGIYASLDEMAALAVVGMRKFDPIAVPDHWQDAGGIRAKAAQTDTMIQGVVIVTVGSVGAIIVDQLDSSFDDPTNTGLSEGQQGLIEGFGTMLDLVKPLLVVLIAVILILAVRRIRQ